MYSGFVRWIPSFDAGSSVPILTRPRIITAYAIAVATDIAQFALGPLGWAFTDEILDVAAMAALWRVIGFHPLLLPTFILEFVPIADLLPTWTGCVSLVVMIRRRQQVRSGPPEPEGTVIDV